MGGYSCGAVCRSSKLSHVYHCGSPVASARGGRIDTEKPTQAGDCPCPGAARLDVVVTDEMVEALTQAEKDMQELRSKVTTIAQEKPMLPS